MIVGSELIFSFIIPQGSILAGFFFPLIQKSAIIQFILTKDSLKIIYKARPYKKIYKIDKNKSLWIINKKKNDV